jgi:hypothetical protein
MIIIIVDYRNDNVIIAHRLGMFQTSDLTGLSHDHETRESRPFTRIRRA